VPIIGELSARRTIDLLEQLLTAVVERRARFVILDVTGLSMVDAAAASGLVKAMRATKLLGAAGMLVGISPAIARELGRQHPGELAAPTFATLADGLAAALKQQGMARGRSPA
jgi:rsbT co-antagonist protein RsbR